MWLNSWRSFVGRQSRSKRLHGWSHHPTLGQCLQVLVRDKNMDQALKVLKKRLQREGVFREMKLRSYYEKPSEKRVRLAAEAVRRGRKAARSPSAMRGG
jgi:small subunit ribosomal protein S21